MKPFDVVEPVSSESPLVIEVPHAGLWIDPEAMAYTCAPVRSIARDADLYVDELFADAPSEGATLLIARTSRYLVDLNRSELDFDGEAVDGGGRTPVPRGVVWRLTTDGEPVLTQPLPRAELDRRIECFYRPYHHAIESLLARRVTRFGFAILLCAHSMPSQPRPAAPAVSGRSGRDRSPAPPAVANAAFRADLVPGTRGRTSAAGAVIDRVDAHGRAHGWTIRHDDPYRGGFSTVHYGRPARGVHAIQIEIARRRYMDETLLRIDPEGFTAVKEFARSLAARLAFNDPAAPVAQLRG